ncbi:hypothetical protein CAI21_02785 [Alkalilimnicola ehrlichii]|uniref:Ferritin-like diiron domain-containing protein n=1 Tax=Alkalilimnicola ehrlichii TaxID=351052 RepID=A0A3E0X0C6_9GAMM|nr:ferritin-like domain-containing protein [Alkalilimnicola ehrlichii]RFA30920.1 hypothetical protein CAI21_02785 [Alkalilimnicola ehrlichii]RFA38870.1 hypothetical protein CAL65_02920 [Alkalilimnicola ehrlichii]
MTRPTDTGTNRTGLDTAPVQAREILQTVPEQHSEAVPGEQLEMARIRQSYMQDAEVIGTVPPPASMKGAATTAKEMLKGNKPSVFIDKLGERLAFERSGVRLYDAVLTKFDTVGSWDGGPSREELNHIRDEELAHFKMVTDAMERLGADPTSMTPSADLAAVESAGVMQAITDPRTSLPEALHALLIAERADVDGWSMLIDLAENAGQTGLADDFRKAHQREEEHARKVKNWVAGAISGDMARQLSGEQEQRSPRSS